MKIHGRATIRFDGIVVDTDDDAELTIGGVKNNSRMAGNNFHHNQTRIPSKFEGVVNVTKQVSLSALQSMSEVEVTFTSDIGKIWVIRNGCQTGEVKFKGGADGGKANITIEGEPAEEMEI